MPPNLPVPRAILFDWDGTLVDAWKAIIASYNITRIAMGMDPWDEDTARQNIRKSWRDAFPEVFGDRAEEAGKIYRDQYGSINSQYIDPMPGAFELLAELHVANIYLGVVSNKSGPYLRREIQYFNWENYFSQVVGAGDSAHDKPHSDPVHMALAGSDIAPGPDVWFVGDTGLDMQTAHQAGITPILVNAHHLKPGELDAWPPAAIFEDLAALHRALQSARNALPTKAAQGSR